MFPRRPDSLAGPWRGSRPPPPPPPPGVSVAARTEPKRLNVSTEKTECLIVSFLKLTETSLENVLPSEMSSPGCHCHRANARESPFQHLKCLNDKCISGWSFGDVQTFLPFKLSRMLERQMFERVPFLQNVLTSLKLESWNVRSLNVYPFSDFWNV